MNDTTALGCVDLVSLCSTVLPALVFKTVRAASWSSANRAVCSLEDGVAGNTSPSSPHSCLISFVDDGPDLLAVSAFGALGMADSLLFGGALSSESNPKSRILNPATRRTGTSIWVLCEDGLEVGM